jgi:hypothetical protein
MFMVAAVEARGGVEETVAPAETGLTVLTAAMAETAETEHAAGPAAAEES